MNKKAWLYALFGFSFFSYVFLFNPKLRYDGLVYLETARSLVFDQDLNVYNENYYFTGPGWEDVHARTLLQKRDRPLLRFMNRPEYTERGYKFAFMPMGNTFFWLFPMTLTKVAYCVFPSLSMHYPDDGYSWPYLFAFSSWNIFWHLLGLALAFRFLSRFFKPATAAVAVIATAGASNILPFIFIDVTFSHGFNFFLTAAFLELWRRSRESARPGHYLLWGMVGGLALIVRYQDGIMLAVPVIDAGLGVIKRRRKNEKLVSLFRHAGWTFVAGFIFIVGVQNLYWKITYDSFFIPPAKMGASAMPSLNWFKPEIIPLLFSQYHGLFSWMPLLAVFFVGLCLFSWKKPRWGFPLMFVFIGELFYNSTRTDWWSMGFSGRRMAGFTMLLMPGAAFLLDLCRRRFLRIISYVIIFIFVLWNFLFMAEFYHHQFRRGTAGAYMKLVNDRGPYQEHIFGWIGPSFMHLPELASDNAVWFRDFSMAGKLFIKAASGIEFKKTLARLIGFLVLFFIPAGIAFLLFDKSMRIRVKSGAWRFILSACIVVFYGSLWTADRQTSLIRSPIIKNGRMTGRVEAIRIHKDSPFLGENKLLTPDMRPRTDTLRTAFDEYLSARFIELTLLKKGEAGHPLTETAMVHSADQNIKTKNIVIKLNTILRSRFEKVEGNFGNTLFDENLYRVRITVPEFTRDKIAVLELDEKILRRYDCLAAYFR